MDFEKLEKGEWPQWKIFPAASNHCADMIKPRASVYLAAIGPGELALTIACCVLAMFILGIYIEEIYHLETRLGRWKPKRKALVLLAIYPVTAVNAMVALLIPRTTGLSDLCTSIYYSLCVFLFSQMLILHFGGKENMVRKLRDTQMRLQTPPCCCCCCCLPTPKLTVRNLKIVEILVVQFVIYKPVSTYIAAIVISDAGATYAFGDERTTDYLYQGMTILNTISTFLAVYGNMILFRMSRVTLKKVNIGAKFYLIQGVIVLENIQRLILSLLLSADLIGCMPPLNTVATSDRFHHQLLIFEMLVLAIIARIYYRYDMLAHHGDDMMGVMPKKSVSVMTNDDTYGTMNGDMRNPGFSSTGTDCPPEAGPDSLDLDSEQDIPVTTSIQEIV